jgi:hypothetical protein
MSKSYFILALQFYLGLLFLFISTQQGGTESYRFGLMTYGAKMAYIKPNKRYSALLVLVQLKN